MSSKKPSPAQLAARKKFQDAVKLANELKKKDPKLKHADAVKKAFAQLKSKSGGAPKRKTMKPKTDTKKSATKRKVKK